MMFEAQAKETLESDRSRKSPVVTQVVICQRRFRKGRDVGSVWWERGRGGLLAALAYCLRVIEGDSSLNHEELGSGGGKMSLDRA